MLEKKPCFHITFLNSEDLGKCSIIECAYIVYFGRWLFLLAKSDTVIQPNNKFPVIFIWNQNVPKEQEIPGAELDATSGLRVVRSLSLRVQMATQTSVASPLVYRKGWE